VGVFVDAPAGLVSALATLLALDVVQLHGAESADTLKEVREAGTWKIWKALRPRSIDDFLRGVDDYSSHVDGLLVDGFSAVAEGGAGVRFPWDAVAQARQSIAPELQLIVAGGLDAGNVARAIEMLSPDVVDVSSGVETTVGEKDVHRTVAFVNAARAAERRAAPAR
jgi:phosphoribosylanthranilate isomerase